MITAVAFLVAAAVGAALRAVLATDGWRIYAVNITGSFLLGLASGLDRPVLTVLGVGALGSFTTFSSFIGVVVGAAGAEEGVEGRRSLPRGNGLGDWRRLLPWLVAAAAGVGAALLGLTLAGI